MDALIEAAKKTEESLWRDIQSALRRTKTDKIYPDLKSFLTTANFGDVGDSIQSFFYGTSRQYWTVEDEDKFFDNMFISFQDNIRRALESHNVQDYLIDSFLANQDLFNNFKSGYTGKFVDDTPIAGGPQSLIEEIKQEAMRVAWTSQFPNFDFKIEPWGSRGNSTDLQVQIKYAGPQGGGPYSLAFYEDIKSRLDGMNLGKIIKDYDEELFKELTSRAKYKYTDGSYVISIKGTIIDQYAAEAIGKKVGKQGSGLNRRVFYSDAKGNIELLSDVLSSPDLEARIIRYYTADHRKKMGISLLSGYAKRRK